MIFTIKSVNDECGEYFLTDSRLTVSCVDSWLKTLVWWLLLFCSFS